MKQRHPSKLFAYILLLFLFTAVFAQAASANSAESPNLTVIVSSPSPHLALSIRFSDGSKTDAIPLEKEQKAWEAYYRFFHYMDAPLNRPLKGATLVVKTDTKSFECALPEAALSEYSGLITLNIEKESIAVGQPPYRLFLLVSMRVLLTLLIEGLIFFAFMYRKKASWLVFLIVNLITQGALNIGLLGPNLGSYWEIGFLFYEIIIFAVEMTVFAIALKEHKKGRAILCAFTANLASLILGDLLISHLPV